MVSSHLLQSSQVGRDDRHQSQQGSALLYRFGFVFLFPVSTTAARFQVPCIATADHAAGAADDKQFFYL